LGVGKGPPGLVAGLRTFEDLTPVVAKRLNGPLVDREWQ
jgi:hypothetical protein